jgi:hypothetical protein
MSISYTNDIRPQFTQIDIDHMSFFCDLSNYDDVKTSAQEILSRLKATDETMMPPVNIGGPWSAANIDKFEAWVAGGCQP